MGPETWVPLLFIAGYLAVTIIIGILARMKGAFSVSEYLVAGRTLGLALIFVMLAGDIYSGFAFLGVGGYAYTFGAPGLYGVVYGFIAYTIAYTMAPKIYAIGKRFNFETQPDFIRERYNSKFLALLFTLFGIMGFLPYLELQLLAGGLVFNVVTNGVVSTELGIIISVIVVAFYCYTSGLRGTSIISLVQASIMFVIGVAAAVWFLPAVVGGGWGHLFERLASESAAYLTLPGATGNLGYAWFTSTLLLSGLGFYVWPHLFANMYTARNKKVIKQSTMIMPLYGYLIVFVMSLGLASVLEYPDLANPDMAVLFPIQDVAPLWFWGLIAAAATAATMSTYDTLAISASGLVGKNIYKDFINPEAPEMKVAWVTRITTTALLIVSAALAVLVPDFLVNLLLGGYGVITQFFPAVIFGLYWRDVSKEGAITGLLVGQLINGLWSYAGGMMPPIPGNMNPGFVAFVVNIILCVLISLVTEGAAEETLEDFKVGELETELEEE